MIGHNQNHAAGMHESAIVIQCKYYKIAIPILEHIIWKSSDDEM